MVGQCCAQPTMQWTWRYGLYDESRNIVRFDDMHCTNCGRRYTWDDNGGSACPVLQLSEDGRALLLRIRPDPVVPPS